MKARFLSRPKDFTYAELESLLKILEYEEIKTGKTAGSRKAFINRKTKHILRLHKPHPGNELKVYQIDYIIQELENRKIL
ncbi:MAG: type II toxin-antitoxin system HicA family toxin [Bacteroidales bacterium]|nr:type II toxin-antitoxin system HicA family toxin [Bacteroidales bacterium]